METITTIEQLQDAVRGHPRVHVTGGGTKSALSGDANLSVAKLSGILEYDPSEFTFTALAGTPLAEIQRRLAEHGQYLPFDPPLVDSGATLGGTVAAGLSGSGRYRYGGIRDFILGVRLVTGTGQLVVGGSKVVKNAAGFDIPKLLVGSLNRLGVIAELTFKVFPEPQSYATLLVELPDIEAAVDAMTRLAIEPFQLHCLDLHCSDNGASGRLCLRIGGIREALVPRLARLEQFLDQKGRTLRDDEDRRYWNDANHFRWVPEDHALVKLPMGVDQIVKLEKRLGEFSTGVPRRYCVAGHMTWLAWPASLPVDHLDALLLGLGRPALALTGNWPSPVLGTQNGQAFVEPLLGVFDPEGKFQPRQQTAGA